MWWYQTIYILKSIRRKSHTWNHYRIVFKTIFIRRATTWRQENYIITLYNMIWRYMRNILYYYYYYYRTAPKMVEIWTKERNIIMSRRRRRTRRLTRTITAEQIILYYMSADIVSVLIPNALTIHFLYTVANSCFHLDTTYRFLHTTLGSRVTFSLLNTYRQFIKYYYDILWI